MIISQKFCFVFGIKIFETFVNFFFRSTKLVLRALAKYYKDSILTKNFAPKQLFFLKKQVKNTVFFGKSSFSRFFGPRSYLN